MKAQSLLRMRSITWPVHRRSPETTRNNFLPRIAYSLYNFYAATMTIKGSLYLSISMLKRFSVAKKTKVQSKSVPEMAVFRKFKDPNIKYSHRDPKRHFLTRNDVIWRILRKYPSRVVGCSLIEQQKNEHTTIVTPKARQNHVFGEQKPLNRSLQNFACRVPSRK